MSDSDMPKVVVVVDDNLFMLKTIEGMLDAKIFKCELFGDGEEALLHLSVNHVDLLITDIIMPGIEGVEMILTACARYPNLPIVAMSGGGIIGEGILSMAQRLGAHAVLAKPFTRDDLLKAIAEAQLNVSARLQDP